MIALSTAEARLSGTESGFLEEWIRKTQLL